MSVFGLYSKYYDLLYKDKNYKAEADYIHELIQKYKPGAETIFEMGCGTGKHAFELSKYGYGISGIDLSEKMLESAEVIVNQNGLQGKLSFEYGDIRSYRTNKRFDVCISLFHVMSYQTTNDDLINALSTAAFHLKEGGLFIFDCWYGPAVLTDRPTVRAKRFSDEETEIVRIAEPVMNSEKNTVDVNYEIIIKEIKTDLCKTIKETHKMRYLFTPEILMAFERTGFSILGSFEFMTGRNLDYNTWNGCYVGRKI